MENVLASFFGSFVASALVLLIFIRIGTKPNTAEPQEKQEDNSRRIPQNIGMFADPLERYKKYRDDESGLYLPIKKEGVNRLGKD